MSKQSTPILRFSGFTDDWQPVSIKAFAPLQRGFDLPVSEIIPGEHPVVFSNGILKRHSQFKVRAPGVVTGRSGTIGKVTYVGADFWPHNTALWVTTFFDNDPKYVYYFYEQFGLERFGTGSSVPTLNRNDVHIQVILKPSLPEQQKIAIFLTTIDDKIQQLTRKKSLLEQYKKGIMQKIFNREIRFKDDDGKEFPGWVSKKLFEIGEIVTGRTPSTSNLDFWDGDVLFVTPTDISINQKYQRSSARSIKIVDGLKVLPAKSILFTCIASIGKMALSEGVCVTNQQINSVIPSNDYDNEFVYYSLLFRSSYIVTLGANTTVPIINKTEFSKVEIMVPCLFEQGRIANFLSAIDKKINHVFRQIELTRQYKKGLLQQMFV